MSNTGHIRKRGAHIRHCKGPNLLIIPSAWHLQGQSLSSNAQTPQTRPLNSQNVIIRKGQLLHRCEEKARIPCHSGTFLSAALHKRQRQRGLIDWHDSPPTTAPKRADFLKIKEPEKRVVSDEPHVFFPFPRENLSDFGFHHS